MQWTWDRPRVDEEGNLEISEISEISEITWDNDN